MLIYFYSSDFATYVYQNQLENLLIIHKLPHIQILNQNLLWGG